MSLRDPFAEWRAAGETVFLDGGLGTELERRGADLRDPLWSARTLVDDPGLVARIHEDYFRAGADVGVSASYQASYLGLARRGVGPREATGLFHRSVDLVREARDRFWADAPPGRRRPLVAASVGCYGATLGDGSEYRGRYDLDADDLVEWHRPRLETLIGAGPDLVACETIPCLAEAEALVRLVSDFPDVAFWVSFACRDAAHLSTGEPASEAFRLAGGVANVVAVGVNCVAPEHAAALGVLAAATSGKPALVYPNSGETWDAATGRWSGSDVWDWPRGARAWRAAGVGLIGGCCRTTPDTIRAIRAALQ